MSCNGNNATPPSPGLAPGGEHIDAAAEAAALGQRWPGGLDPRVRAFIPEMDAPFFQAGLAGYSDAAMRIIARRHGAPLCVTEALLDRMLLGGGHGFDKADLALQEEHLLIDNLPAGKEDRPLVGQIIGSDPDEMAAAALKMIEQGQRHDRAYRDMAYGAGGMPTYVDTRWKPAGASEPADAVGCEDDCTPEALQVPEQYDPRMVFEHAAVRSASTTQSARTNGEHSQPGQAGPVGQASDGRIFEAMDVNLACPVKKIDRKSRGGHWLTDPAGAIAILKAVRAAVPASVPCTVKLRRAYDDTPEMAKNFERIFVASYELGYAWATVHGRTVEQRYIGPSRWDMLRDLANRHRDKVIFGSGDIWNVEDIFRMIAYTGVSGVSVARGCIGNPWIFRQARQLLAGEPKTEPTLPEQRAVLLDHFKLSVALNGERVAGKLMRKFGIKFAKHHPDPEAVKRRMCSVNHTADWLATLDEVYPAPSLAHR